MARPPTQRAGGWPGYLPEALTHRIHRLVPGAQVRLAALFFEPPHEFAFAASAVALRLPELEALVAGMPLEFLPGSLAHTARRRQLAYLGGRMCAEEALHRATGRRSRVERGVDGMPLWPAGTRGSISHTGTVACAVAAARSGAFGVGIDVEPAVVDEDRKAIESVCMSDAERSRLRTAGDPRLVATVVLSAKEALYKAIYPALRRFVDFDEFEVTAIDADRGIVAVEATAAFRGTVRVPAMDGRWSVDAGTVYTSIAAREP